MRFGSNMHPRLLTLADAMLGERPWPVSIAIAFSLGLVYALTLLGPNVAFGTAPFWDMPSLNSGTLDIRNALAGYWWFARDLWRWPLLALPNANWPEGTNAELFDVCPLAAIIGKVLGTTLGRSVNPYPWWVTSCFAMNAVALTSLVRALGHRSLLGTILAGAFGAMAPVVQHRLSLGHMSLLAHWIPILALALYFTTTPRRFNARAIVGFTGLALLATIVHLYLYVMTAAIGAGAVLQAVIDHRASLRLGIISIALLLLAGVLPLWFLGLLDTGDLASTQGYGYGVYSMNLVSPFWPQTSGLFRWTGNYWLTRGSIGATKGQYDGFDYLGGGVLLLLGVAIWRDAKHILSTVRRHIGLVIVLSLLTIWALSSHVYLGPYMIVSYEVPQLLASTVLSWFRSSARFFWPGGWLLVGLGLSRTLSIVRPPAAVMLGVIALVLQWCDVAPWREKFAQLLDAPTVSAFGPPEAAARVAQAISAAGAVAVIPPIFCSSAGGDYDSPLNLAALEVEIMAARANARMPSVYLSRHINCLKTPNLGIPGVLIILKDAEKSATRREALPEWSGCDDFPIARLCVVGSNYRYPDSLR